jgi:hypothetical protein
MKGRTGWRLGAVVAALALSAPAVASARYTLVASPNAFAGNNVLNGVSASSQSDAWAVGSLCCSPVRHSGLGTLTEHWNGTAWSIVPSPDTVLNDDVLTAVADVSPTNAWAVGEVNQSSFKTRHPLIVHWNGTSWSTVAAPSNVPIAELLAVNADSASDVWAVGDDQHGSGVILHFNGVSWSSFAAPALAGGETLQGVKAFSPTNVWAVGGRFSGCANSIGKTLILHFNGTAWSIVPSPSPDPKGNVLAAVGGFSATNVWAVGCQGLSETTTGVPPGTRTLTEHWNGTTWSAVSSPSVGDEDSLTGVAAPSAAVAATVGSDNNTSGSIPIARTLAEAWTGTTWSVAPTPNVGTSDNLLKGVAAIPGSVAIWAVGFHLTPGGPYQTVILHN